MSSCVPLIGVARSVVVVDDAEVGVVVARIVVLGVLEGVVLLAVVGVVPRIVVLGVLDVGVLLAVVVVVPRIVVGVVPKVVVVVVAKVVVVVVVGGGSSRSKR